MFGLTDYELDTYRDRAQDFATNTVVPDVLSNSIFYLPYYIIDGENFVDAVKHQAMATDVEIVITLTASHMAYDYANLQCESDMSEADIIEHLHSKYENYVLSQFIRYGLGFTLDVLATIVGDLILELPYMYVSVIEDIDFNEDEFLEERLAAYNDYLNDHAINPDGDEEEQRLDGF